MVWPLVTRQWDTSVLTGFAAWPWGIPPLCCSPCTAETRNLRLFHLSQPCFLVMVLAELAVPTVPPAFEAQMPEPLHSQVLNYCSLEHMVEGKLLPILVCLKALHHEPWQFRKWVMSGLDVQAGSTAGTSIFISYLIPDHQAGLWVSKTELSEYLPVCSQCTEPTGHTSSTAFKHWFFVSCIFRYKYNFFYFFFKESLFNKPMLIYHNCICKSISNG